jgi:hypothetical protein
MWWSSSSGCIELNITKAQARMCFHSGDCEPEVRYLITCYPKIRQQLQKIEPTLLVKVLKEYGAWNTTELADHEMNKIRLLWIATGDLAEELI